MTFGVHPYLPFLELQKRFTPLVEYLSKETGYEIQLRIGVDYSEHIASFGSGVVDIAYLGPAEYVRITQMYGLKPLLGIIETAHTIYFTGYIIVRKNSPLHSLSALNLNQVAFVDPNSTMGYLIPVWMISQEQPDLSTKPDFTFLGDHNNVAMGVLVGDYMAGAVKEEVFHTFKERGLRSLAITPQIPEHCFAIQPTVPTETIEVLRQAFYKLGNDEKGLKILQDIKQSITGVLPVEDEQYDGLRLILNRIDSLEIVK